MIANKANVSMLDEEGITSSEDGAIGMQHVGNSC